MTIERQIQDLLKTSISREPKSESLARLEEFYNRMKDRGLIRKHEYSIPPLDTVGRGAYVESRARGDEPR